MMRGETITAARRFGAAILFATASQIAWGQTGGPPPNVAPNQNPGSLKRVPIPRPTNLTKYVKDQNALVVPEKSHRAQNQLSNPSGTFSPNHLLSMDEIPFHAL